MPALPRAFALTLAPSLVLLALLAPATALAAAATTSQQVNLRSGPATSYDVIGQLAGGQAVEVRQCEGKFCQVAYAGKSGWVSASFLTRGAAPSLTPTPTPGAPQIAAVAPPGSPPAVAATSSGTMPPAYKAAPVLPQADINDDATDDNTAADDAPRPKVDVPGARIGVPGDDGDMASADASEDDDAFAADDGGSDDDAIMAPPPDVGPRGFAPRGFRRDFAGLDIGPDRACFVDAGGGNGFCIRAGERIDMPGRWSRHTLLLRNPQRLDVTVCTAGDECHNYLASGPVLVGDRPIASISVAAPGY